ncbi:Hypothetical protein CAP_4538 [Chondromyces apiculatus DSM 436]|uniref:Uncharacterized protein n=1 Tax=Chondromyces apiculatus DSM 436 TaxID=1192034 RepID=A0A017T587_9BACT|nr:Hypothetical protein CAP_4538 [Chondromyces apiculatus DSM 436]
MTSPEISLHLSREVRDLSGEIDDLSGEINDLSGEVDDLSGEINDLSRDIPPPLPTGPRPRGGCHVGMTAGCARDTALTRRRVRGGETTRRGT